MTLRLSGGRRLRSPAGTQARPTTARVRQAVTNMLAGVIPGCRWLDLCSGSGAMACEALQRGAGEVVAVERDRRIAAVARANLEAVALSRQGAGRVRVYAAEVLGWLSRGRPQPFDLIYLDPPYAADLYEPVARAVALGGWLAPGGRMLWECASGKIPEPPPGWELEQCRRYGGSSILLLAPEPAAGSATEGGIAPVLVPGSHEEAHQGDGDEAEHDAAEQGFDHGQGGRSWPEGSSRHNSSMRATGPTHPLPPA